jgi:hypothetical protein
VPTSWRPVSKLLGSVTFQPQKVSLLAILSLSHNPVSPPPVIFFIARAPYALLFSQSTLSTMLKISIIIKSPWFLRLEEMAAAYIDVNVQGESNASNVSFSLP